MMIKVGSRSLESWLKQLFSCRCLVCGAFLVLTTICLVLYKEPELPFLVMTSLARSSKPEHTIHYRQNCTPEDGQLLNSLMTNSSCSQTRPKTTKLLHGVWHTARDKKHWTTIRVYGAYVDDRGSDESQLVLRLFAVSIVPKKSGFPLCLLWFSNMSHPLPTAVTSANDIGRGYFFEGVNYQERMYTCDLPEIHTLPTHVSVEFSECQEPTNMIPVQYQPPTEPKHDLGVCVAVSYGKIHPLKLIEWIEFNRILGVSGIHLYNSSISGPANDVLSYFAKTGYLHLSQTGPPLYNWCQYCQKLTVVPALNDCLYRNMHKYRYIMVIDFDEMIIPYFHDTIPSLLRNLESFTGLQQPAFTFSNAYFFLDFGPTVDDSTSLLTMQYLTRTSVSAQGYASKSVIDPRSCLVLQNHYCMTRTRQVGSYWTKAVDPKYAVVHHYKNCHFGPEECGRLLSDKHNDKSTLKYIGQLRDLVDKVRDKIFL